jgi:predicted Zn-dependent protease
MGHSELEVIEAGFSKLADYLVSCLHGNEHLTIGLNSERSQFTRFNHAKVRQTGVVADGTASLNLICNQREANASFPFTGDWTVDSTTALDNLEYLRREVAQLPENPYAVLPENKGSSREVYRGELLSAEQVIDAILEPARDVDFIGFYAAGAIARANANSAGQKHWFATETFSIDYSMFTEVDLVGSSTGDRGADRAVKGGYAGRNWQQSAYAAEIARSKQQLQDLSLPAKSIQRGQYRTYFAPDAAAELLGMLSGAVGEASLQQGSSALLKLRQGERQLSPLLNLKENFRGGSVPRFNELGEMSPEELPAIVAGKLVNPLVSTRSAKEYSKVANGASSGEYMRSPEVGAGDLPSAEILTRLGTGMYLSNLHYLNWSDRPGGRITGMTRYACFWVENGEIVAPIENLRFDDGIYDFLNANLEAFTDFQEFIPATDTYGSRSLGGITVPGMLVSSFTFTL